jgi:mono/diheme cytochrome c family protein
MLRIHPKLAALCTCALGVTPLLWARPQQPSSPQARFEQLDRNKDGFVTPDEAADPAQFQMFDMDKDGRVSLAEVLSVVRARRPGASVETPQGDGNDTAIRKGEPEKRRDDGPPASMAGIGRRIALPPTFVDLSGTEHPLEKSFGPNGLVLALTSSSCPVSKRYLPTLAKLRPQLASHGLGLLLVPASDSEDSLRKLLAEHGLADCCAATPAWGGLLEAQSTAEVFLLDRARTLLYRGALDDQYGPGYSRPEPSRHLLMEAVAQFEAGEFPSPASTSAPGCELAPDARVSTTAVTYHGNVSRILQRHCGTCHVDGGIAPFPLGSPEEVLEKSRTIQRVLERQSMPPWFAAPVSHGQASPWKNDRTLPDRDRADLLQWLRSKEHPLGDPAHAPIPLRKTAGQWAIGAPDLTLQIPKPIEIPAGGTMPYQFAAVVAPTMEDRWVQAYEILPTAREVVHHVLVNVVARGTKIKESGEGYWAAYVPGNSHQIYPADTARRLPAGATLTFQIHYSPNGSATSDQLRIGLRFSKTPPTQEVLTLPVANHRILIPPGAADHTETFTRTLPTDFTVSALMAHMHVRGKAFKYELQTADGNWETLLDLPRYDFNWQLRYEWLEPRLLRKGSVLRLTAVFDNSPGNRANPNPAQTVRWGPQTSDEMMIGYVEHLRPVAR